MSITLTQPTVSKSDDRQYKLIKLTSNDLEVLLVSDPTTDKSSAAVNVNAGQLQDPIERQGLAHFLEHMLFLGTKKYPDATQFDEHLNSNSGYSNAFTALDQTNYFFHCSNAGFKEGLDRFAQFFIEPLFTQDLTSREMNAVHSENQKNLQSDLWRLYQLSRSTSKPNNIYNKFGTGNLETLNFPSTRDDLIKFYQTYYSSNIMKAAILSNESLDQLEAQAVELFSSVPNRQIKSPTYNESPFDSTNLGQILKVVPIKQEKKIEFEWFFPYYSGQYKKNPASLLSHLFGHEGENSLMSTLINCGLGEKVNSSQDSTMKLFTTLSISITLTEEGFKRYQDVVSLVFQYAKLFQQKANVKWIFEEHKKVQQLRFDYKDKEEPIDYTYVLAGSMQNFSHQDILSAEQGHEEYDQVLIQNALDHLTPQNLRIYLSSQTLENECNQVEYFYKTKYSIEPFSQEIFDLYQNPKILPEATKIDVPIQNTFLPSNFDLLPTIEQKGVESLLNDDKIEVWYKKDDTFKVPKVSIFLRFKNNESNGVGTTALGQVSATLWTSLFNEYTRELSYLAYEACISSTLRFDNELTLKIEGFSDSIVNFVTLYLQKLAEFEKSDFKKSFEILHSKQQRDFSNFIKQAPYQQGATHNDYLLLARAFSPKQLEEECSKITFETFQEFHQNFLKSVRLELFIGGNLTSEEALKITKIFTEQIFDNRKASALRKEDILDRRVVAQREGEVGVYESNLGEDETNSYICANFEVGENRSTRSRVILELLLNYVEQEFFTQIRTNECLGYICSARSTDYRGVGFIRFISQSDVQPPQYISSRIEEFLQIQLERLKKFSNAEFDTLKNSVEVTIKEKDFSISQQSQRFFSYITTHHYTFNLKELMQEELQKITKEDLLAKFQTVFGKTRKVLQLHLVSPKHLEKNTLIKKVTYPYNNFQTIDNPDANKLKSSLHPDYFAYAS